MANHGLLTVDIQEVAGGKWRWWLIAANGREMARSELYSRKASCVRAVRSTLMDIRHFRVQITVEHKRLELY